MEFIEKTNEYGSKLGLISMIELMNHLGNPQNELRVIHIAGTNGKGSTLSFLSNVLIEAGEKVGQFTSPSVYQYLEKIKMNDKMIAKRTFAKYLTKVQIICKKMVSDGFSHPTTFEIETAVAFCFFKDRKCSIVLIETGLGGAEDATNVMCQAKICVFTSISLDHMEFLGDTVEKITKEKAGIITEKSIVVAGINPEIINNIIREETEKKGGMFLSVTREKLMVKEQSLEKQKFSYNNYVDISIQMCGGYQIENAALAIEVLDNLTYEKKWVKHKISELQLRMGLGRTNWMGRFSILAKNPFFIVDGAHNEHAAKKLRESMDIHFTKHKIIYIIGILKDKEYKKIISNMVPLANQIITVTTPNNRRAFPAYNLAQEIQKVNPMVTAADSLEEAVEMAYLLADKDTVILAFGSLSYLGELTELVKHKDRIRRDSHGRS
jgi:dihydrofolate synthase/folylpolyglutamate synthase